MSEPAKKRPKPGTDDAPRVHLDQVLEQASRYFMGKADVQSAARRVSRELDRFGIKYAVAGGLSVAAHGHVRVTNDVDILLTPDGLSQFKEHCLGRGWVEKFAGSRGVRDADLGVPIDFLLTGEYPGDGQAKPVQFPDPADVGVDGDGFTVVRLSTLIELKLASAMTAPERVQDLADVIQLIRVRSLERDYAEGLCEYVRDRFDELWQHAQIRRDVDY